MNGALAGWLQFALLVAALAACYVPIGNYMAHIFTTDKDWKVERGIYKLIGVDPKADQRWASYLRSMLAFSLISVLFLYALERLQHYLLLSLGMANVPPALAWNTAASFVTNTNWQNYSGESTMGYVVQMSGLAVQNFLSAAVGIVVAIALVRGFVRSRTDRLGNFWVDLTRITVRYLIPLSVIGAIILVAAGAIDNFSAYHTVTTLSGGAPDHRRRPGRLAGGHQGRREQRRRLLQRQLLAPVREPEPVHELVRDLPAAGDRRSALPRTFGKMVKDNAAGLCAARGDDDHLARGRRRDQLLRGTSTPGSPRSWRTPRWRARRSGSASPARRCSRRRPR